MVPICAEQSDTLTKTAIFRFSSFPRIPGSDSTPIPTRILTQNWENLDPELFSKELKISKPSQSVQNRVVHSRKRQFSGSRPLPGFQFRIQPPPNPIFTKNRENLDPELYCKDLKISKPSQSVQSRMIHSEKRQFSGSRPFPGFQVRIQPPPTPNFT